MKKRFNPNLAKLHRSYTISEVAGLYQVHKNTVSNWIKAGLPICDTIRPTLILGNDLRCFMQERRAKQKRKCRIDEVFCLRCKSPVRPVDGLVEYKQLTPSRGCLSGLCPVCTCLINKYVSVSKLDVIRQHLNITIENH